MSYKIVADSTADLHMLEGVNFSSVPLKITVGETTYVDDEKLDVDALVQTLSVHKGRSCTACPNPDEWLEAFGDADEVFCVTITSTLSGSYNAARLAAEEYEAAHPGRRVHVIDTLSAGPEMTLIVEKLAQLVKDGLNFDAICEKIKDYLAHTRLGFVLQSVRNLANNGRVNPAIAALVGMLGIRIVGQASDHGDLQQTNKGRGDKRALADLVALMQKLGYAGGRVRIHHCSNLSLAESLRDMLKKLHDQAEIVIDRAHGLCSYYAEKGGMLVGFEIE